MTNLASENKVIANIIECNACSLRPYSTDFKSNVTLINSILSLSPQLFLCTSNEVDYPPPYDNRGSLDKASLPSHRDSLDYYGEEPPFKEDGSFTEEYRDPDKKNAPPDEEYPGLATFV